MNPRSDINGQRYWAGSELEYLNYVDAVEGRDSPTGITIGGKMLSSYPNVDGKFYFVLKLTGYVAAGGQSPVQKQTEVIVACFPKYNLTEGGIGGVPAEDADSGGLNWVDGVSRVIDIFSLATDIAVMGPKPKYTGAGNWIKMTKAGSRFGTKLGVAGVLLTGVDAHTQGEWKNHHTADAVLGTGLTIGGTIPVINVGVGIFAGAYFIIDFGVQIYSGKSITEHLFD